MARQTSMFQLEGSMGDFCFYKTKDGYFVRRKSSISKRRIKTDPAYALVRKSNAEFGRAAQAGKLFRSAFRSLLRRAGVNRISGKLTAAFLEAIQRDETHPRGQRTVRDGELQLLQGFELNQNLSLTRCLLMQYNTSIDRNGGLIVAIPPFDPATMLGSPANATHFRFLIGGAAIDFERDSYDLVTSESLAVSLKDDQTPHIHITQKLRSQSVGPVFMVLGVEFFQVVNGKELPLIGAEGNPLAIVEVSDR